MLRSLILLAATSPRVRGFVTEAPVSSSVVARYVAGEGVDDALSVARRLADSGLVVSLDHLGEQVSGQEQAAINLQEYVWLLRQLNDQGLAGAVEVSVKLSALGQSLDPLRTLDYARLICAAADKAGSAVTIDMEDHHTTDSTLKILRELRQDFPHTGTVLQAYLRRTEDDCRELACPGSRIRLVKGAYAEPDSVSYQHKHDVDRSYVRCLRVLMSAGCYPMIATHDRRLIAIAQELASKQNLAPGSYEFQMLYGVRPLEQQRLATAGETVRVYVPYGARWYEYLMRRLAERPANVGFFLRSLAGKR